MLADRPVMTVPAASVEGAAKLVAGTSDSYTVALRDLAALADKGPLSSFHVREWTGHLLVNGLTRVQRAPEPATMVAHRTLDDGRSPYKARR